MSQSRITMSMFVALAAVLLYPLVMVLRQGLKYQAAAAGIGILYYALGDVMDGHNLGRQGLQLGSDLQDVANAIMYNLKTWAGIVYLNPAVKLCNWSWMGFAPENTGSAEQEFCQALLNYLWEHPEVSGLAYPTVFAGREDVHAWSAACMEELNALSDEEHSILEPWLNGSQALPLSLLVPEVPEYGRQQQLSRKEAQGEHRFEDGLTACKEMSNDELNDLLIASISRSSYSGLREELLHTVKDYWKTLKVCQPLRIPSTWDAVQKAVVEGSIATFDARSLLPEWLLNMSLQDVAAMEGESSTTIPIAHDGLKMSSLARVAEEQTSLLNSGQEHNVDFNLASPYVVDPVCFNSTTLGQLQAAGIPQAVHGKAGYVNARRLPNLYKRLPNITRLLGLEDEVLRTQTFLWLGATRGGLHYDEEANFYVQLSGESFAIVVPQNFTDLWLGGKRHTELPKLSALEEDPWIKEVPFVLIHLRPGDGLVFPGRTYHRFLAQSHRRMALNWFFQPRWRAMEYHAADWYTMEANKSLVRLALRQHWARSFSKLYDTSGKGMIWMGAKLEYL